MSNGPQVDYDALARQHGGTSAAASSGTVDYDALATQHGAVTSDTSQQQPSSLSRFFSNAIDEARGLGKGAVSTFTTPPTPAERVIAGIGSPAAVYAKRLLFDPMAAKARSTYQAGKEAIDTARQSGLTSLPFRQAADKTILGALATVNPFAPDVTKLFEQSASGDVAGAAGRGAVDIAALEAGRLGKGVMKSVGSRAMAEGLFDTLKSKIGSTPLYGAGSARIAQMASDLVGKLEKYGRGVPDELRKLTDNAQQPNGLTWEEALESKKALNEEVFKDSVQAQAAKIGKYTTQGKAMSAAATSLNQELTRTAQANGLLREWQTANDLYGRAATTEKLARGLGRTGVAVGATEAAHAAGAPYPFAIGLGAGTMYGAHGLPALDIGGKLGNVAGRAVTNAPIPGAAIGNVLPPAIASAVPAATGRQPLTPEQLRSLQTLFKIMQNIKGTPSPFGQ